MMHRPTCPTVPTSPWATSLGAHAHPPPHTMPYTSQPAEPPFHDPLSEHLELRDGLLLSRGLALDLVQLGVDVPSQLVGWAACGVARLAGLEAGCLADGVAFNEGHGVFLVSCSGSFLGSNRGAV